MLQPRTSTSELWAITSYFNPAKYRRRLENYHTFRRHLNIPLVTVELGYGPSFELSPSDADILVQFRASDILWQKERLLNVALRKVPESCQKIAWLDCDVVFDSDQWEVQTTQMLDDFELVQPFRKVHHCSKHANRETSGSNSIIRSSDSIVKRWLEKTVPPNIFRDPGSSLRWGYAPGLAWAGRREILEAHGLYDALVMGYGDKALVCASFGFCEELVHACLMNRQQADHFLSWARRFCRDVGGSVAYADGTLSHLWHGDVTDRRYGSRYLEFSKFDFDPFVDIALDHNGCWRWSTDKDAMHSHVKGYFCSRKEDG